MRGAGREDRAAHRGARDMAEGSASVTTLKSLLEAFNAHDLDRIMSFFAEDCILEMPRGPAPWGARYVGSAAVREGLRSRLAGIPNVQYTDDTHFTVSQPVTLACRNGRFAEQR